MLCHILFFSSSFASLYSELDDVRLRFTTRSFPPGRKTKPCAPPKTVQLLQQIIKWIAHVGRINCNYSCFFGIKQNQGKPFCWKSVRLRDLRVRNHLSSTTCHPEFSPKFIKTIFKIDSFYLAACVCIYFPHSTLKQIQDIFLKQNH